MSFIRKIKYLLPLGITFFFLGALPALAAPTVSITSPNGGETLTVGQTYRITWSSTNVDKVALGYSSCSSCLAWIANTIPNNGSYDWTVNVNSASTKFKIYILAYQTGTGSASDYSDADFTVTSGSVAPPQPSVVEKTIILTSPVTGSTLTIGAPVTIQWSTTGDLSDYNYELRVGNSRSNSERQLYDRVSTIASLPSSQTSIVWNVPDILSDFSSSTYPADWIKNSFYLKIKATPRSGGFVLYSNTVSFGMPVVASGGTDTKPYITGTSVKAGGNFEMDAGGEAIILGRNLAGNSLQTTNIYTGIYAAHPRQASDMQLVFDVPSSLPIGTTQLYVENEKGQSNLVSVRILSKIAPIDTPQPSTIPSQTSDLSPALPIINQISPEKYASKGDLIVLKGKNLFVTLLDADSYSVVFSNKLRQWAVPKSQLVLRRDDASSGGILTLAVTDYDNFPPGDYEVFIRTLQGDSNILGLTITTQSALATPLAPRSVPSQTSDLSQLKQQIAALQAQLAKLQDQQPSSVVTPLAQPTKLPASSSDQEGDTAPATAIVSFDSNLFFGMRKSEDVFKLQEFLIDQGFLKSSATGNYFLLTQSAVKRFQAANNIKASGYFGPVTRGIANKILAGI